MSKKICMPLPLNNDRILIQREKNDNNDNINKNFLSQI